MSSPSLSRNKYRRIAQINGCQNFGNIAVCVPRQGSVLLTRAAPTMAGTIGAQEMDQYEIWFGFERVKGKCCGVIVELEHRVFVGIPLVRRSHSG